MGDEWKTNPDVMKIYVGQLNSDTSQEALTAYFGQHGTVQECNLITDKETQKSKGYSFITFSTPEEVDELLEKTHILDGKTLQVRRAIPRDDPHPLAHTRTKKLFVGGLTEEASEEDIKAVIEPMANAVVESVKLMFDRTTHKFKGYAFVTFSSDHPVDKLFIIRHTTIKNKRVELKKAEDLTGGATSRMGRGRGGGRGRGRDHGMGGRGGGGNYGGGNYGGYGQQYSGGYEGYDTYGSGYDSYSGYGEEYNGYGSYGGGYGSMGGYGTNPSGYGPSPRGRPRGNYKPYWVGLQGVPPLMSWAVANSTTFNGQVTVLTARPVQMSFGQSLGFLIMNSAHKLAFITLQACHTV